MSPSLDTAAPFICPHTADHRRLHNINRRFNAISELAAAGAITGAIGWVLKELNFYSDELGGDIYPSQATIAKRIGCSREYVSKCISWCVDAGYLVPTDYPRNRGNAKRTWEYAFGSHLAPFHTINQPERATRKAAMLAVHLERRQKRRRAKGAGRPERLELGV